jgi:hypothetical protein
MAIPGGHVKRLEPTLFGPLSRLRFPRQLDRTEFQPDAVELQVYLWPCFLVEKQSRWWTASKALQEPPFGSACQFEQRMSRIKTEYGSNNANPVVNGAQRAKTPTTGKKTTKNDGW